MSNFYTHLISVLLGLIIGSLFERKQQKKLKEIFDEHDRFYLKNGQSPAPGRPPEPMIKLNPGNFFGAPPDPGLPEKKETEQQMAEKRYPNHHPKTALANYRAGREIWDTNGDVR